MAAVFTLASVLTILPTVPAALIVTPNDILNGIANGIAAEDSPQQFPEGCDVVCDWDGDKPDLPECTWELCMANIEKTTCTQPEIESADDYTEEERFDSVYSIFLYRLPSVILFLLAQECLSSLMLMFE